MHDKINAFGLGIIGFIFPIAKIFTAKEITFQDSNYRTPIERNGNIIIEKLNMPVTPTIISLDRRDRRRNTSYQQTNLTVDSNNLKQPHLLKIDSIAKQLSGEITLNGRTIRRLTGSRTQINLAPYLTKGEHRLEVSLNYIPASSSVSIIFSAPETNMMQQTSGNGSLKHKLLITVK